MPTQTIEVFNVIQISYEYWNEVNRNIYYHQTIEGAMARFKELSDKFEFISECTCVEREDDKIKFIDKGQEWEYTIYVEKGVIEIFE